MGAISSWHSLTSIFVGIVALFGVCAMFVRAENIERNFLVGGLTIFTALLAGTILYFNPNGLSDSALIGIALLSILGFIVGRLIDFYLGPQDISSDPGRHSFGGDFAD